MKKTNWLSVLTWGGWINVIQYLILAIHNLEWMFYPSIDLISRYWGAIYNLNV